MNEKISAILTAQTKQLKRLGIYTAIVLVIFTVFVAFLGIEMKNGQAPEIAQDSPPAPAAEALPADVAPADSTLKESAEIKKEEIEKTADIKSSENKNTGIISTPLAAAVKIKEIKWPSRGKIIRSFGLSYSQTFSDYRFHKGVDIELQRGSEVAAVLDGKVISTGTTKGDKGVIVISHGTQWISGYAHLNEIYVKAGERVRQGQALGSADQPGLNEVMEGPHLHFELHKEGGEVNPLDYLPK